MPSGVWERGRAHLLDAVRESEVRSQLALESSGDGVWDWNVQTNDIYFSPQWKKILGYADDELPSSVNQWASRVHPDDMRWVSSELQKHLAGEIPFYCTEHRVRCKDGTYKWILDRGRVISRTAEGRPLRMVGTHTDVTSRRQMENELKESRLRYMAIFDKSPIAIAYYDADGRLEMVNEACITMFGIVDPDSIRGLSLFDNPNISKKTKVLLRRGELVRTQFEFSFDLVRKLRLYRTTKKGTMHLDCLITPLSAEDRTTGYVVQTQDITEQKLTEKALTQSEANFSAFFNSVDSLLLVLDRTGTIIATNETVLHRLGYTRDELIGASVTMLHPAERREEAERIVRAIVRGETDQCPLPLVAKDGRRIPVETRITSGRWNGRDVLFGMSKDISELTFSEEKFSKTFQSNASVMMLCTFDDGLILDVNEAFLTTFGYTREEVIGSTFRGLGTFPSTAALDGLRAEMLQKGNLRNVEVRVQTKQGDIRYGLLSVDSLYLQDTPYMLATAVDITERKIAEAKAQQEKEFSDSAIDSLPGIFYLLDRKGSVLRWNKNTEAVTGYSAEEIARMHYAQFFPDSQKQSITEAVRKIFADGHAAIEGDVLSKKGIAIRYFFSGRRVPLNGKEYVIGLGIDITNLKRLEQELRTHQDQLEQKIAERTAELEANREELETKTRTLEEVNTALKVLLHQIGEDKKDLEARFASNVKQLVLPYVEKVKRGRLDSWQQSCLSIIETNLNEIVSPLIQSLGQLGLTPRETQIAALIKEGKTTKEIAEIIGVAPSAVDTNRNRIRHKLQLNNKKVNLQSFLQSMK